MSERSGGVRRRGEESRVKLSRRSDVSLIWNKRVITLLETLIAKESYDIVNDYCEKRMKSVLYNYALKKSNKCESVEIV
jgi:hypothetical protein